MRVLITLEDARDGSVDLDSYSHVNGANDTEDSPASHYGSVVLKVLQEALSEMGLSMEQAKPQ